MAAMGIKTGQGKGRKAHQEGMQLSGEGHDTLSTGC